MAFTGTYAEREPTRAEVDAHKGMTVVEFGAPWCGHCQAVQGELAELFAQHPSVEHLKIYDGKGKPLGRSFRVKLWPTLVFLRDGEVLARLVRPDEAEIKAAFESIV